MKNKGSILLGIALVLGIVATAIGGYILTTSHLNQNYGATIPIIPAVFETSLQSSIGASDTSMTLVSGTDEAGNPISGYICFTIDEGSASAEFVCGTASSTSVTSMIRGIDPIDGTKEVESLKKTHRRGASVKVTDYPALGIISRILNGDETLPNFLEYDSTTTPTSATQLVSKSYVDSVAISGAPVMSTSVSGIGIGATIDELSNGIATSTYNSTDYLNIATAENFASSFTGSPVVPVTNSSGKLDTSFIDQSADYTWTGTSTFTGETNLNGTTTYNGLELSSQLTHFGGDGSDGALSLVATTTTLDLGSAKIFVKNYSSINIDASSTLQFSNPAPNGTFIILKSSGDVTIAGTIDASGMGANYGNGGYDVSGQAGEDGLSFVPFIFSTNGGGAGKSGAAADAGGSAVDFYFDELNGNLSPIRLSVGAGGGGGGTNQSSQSGHGGRGGGAVYIEVRGYLNFTGTINVSGNDGIDGSGYYASGGGGGAGGSLLILYNNLTANTGIVDASGGDGGNGFGSGSGTNSGGSGGGNAGAGGAGGYSASGQDGGDNGSILGGTAGTGVLSGCGGGGGGGAGQYLIIKNNLY